MAFPVSPDNGEQHTIGDVTWEYDSASNAWELLDWQNFGGVTVQVFTSSGTWTKPAGAKIVHVTAIGGSGSAGGGSTYQGDTGGGGGALTSAFFDASLLGATESVVATGAGVSYTFNTLQAGGGGVGSGGLGKYNGGTGGTGGYDDFSNIVYGDNGIDSYGGAAGASGEGFGEAGGGLGGGSPLYSTTNGSAGNNLPIPGGGDSGSYGSANGANGVVVVKVWYG